MPVICIGPVCIPWTCLPPILFFCWKFIKPVLPAAVAESIEAWAKKVWDACAPYVEKIPGFRKKPKAPKSAEEAAAAAASATVQQGQVAKVTSVEQFDAFLEQSKSQGFAVVVDFTAPWCKPCQAMKPKFEELAREHSKHCFLMVDVDEIDELSGRCEVMGLPTFQVYLGGQRVDAITGSGDEKLVGLINKHLAGNDKKGQ